MNGAKANGIRRWEFYKRQRECRNYILENASGCEKLPVPAGNLPSFFEIPVNHQTPSVETGLTESDSIKDKSDGSHIMINYGNFSIDVAGPVNGKNNKFVMGIPFCRQSMDFALSGISISKQTMINWANSIVPGFLDDVSTYMCTRLVKERYIQNDETFIQVNKDGRSPGHKSYMWVHCTSELSDCDPIVVFCNEATRGTDHLRKLFGEFMGYITCDAYVSYQVLESEADGNITVTGCMMHCRRYFAEAFFVNDVASMTDEELAGLPETKVLLLIRAVYAEENRLRDMLPHERKQARLGSVKPRFDELFEYIHFLDGSDDTYSERMQKAVSYAVNQEKHLRVFLEDGSIPIDNGRAERIIRSYSIGRSNWLFADSIKGAYVNATMYSIVETAKANDVNVKMYLQYLLEKIPVCQGEKNDEFWEYMMSWSPAYKEYEKKTAESVINAYGRMFPEPISRRYD